MVLLRPIPGQEERNADMLVGIGAAVRADRARDAGSMVAGILADPARHWRMRAAASASGRPRAAFDIATRIGALALLLGPELPTLGGALLGGLLFAAVLHWRGRGRVASKTTAGEPAASPPALPLARALAPYAVLVALVLATRALPPVAEALGAWSLQWRLWDRFSVGMQPLLHPGTLLLAALLLGTWVQRRPLRVLGPALATSARRLVPVSVALLTMLCLSRLMLHAGMIDTLQEAAVQGLGQAWPLMAPAVGALGSFVTGSATASNVLFTTLQVQTAQALALSPAWMAAAQGLGAGLGNIVCPHNIVAGAATVGLAGREAEVLRRTALPCAVVLALGGGLVWALV
jgi:lactate permease